MSPDDLNQLPEAACRYCYQLWEKYQFHFTISRTRSSKLGDYRYNRATGTGKISVNHGLNPFEFLITFLHEVAHHLVAIETKSRQKPHGKEWKLEFRRLMEPLLNEKIFPTELNQVLVRHMKNPRASMGADIDLWQALTCYKQPGTGSTLFELPDRATFAYRKRVFKKIHKRRTRVLCLELKTRRKYLIPGIAAIDPHE